MNLRYALSFLKLLRIPGLLSVMNDWQSFLRIHFIFAAYESGLLQALAAGPLTEKDLADRLQAVRPDLLEALLQVGLALKELGRGDGRYFLKGKRAKAVTHTRGDVVAAMIQANVSYYHDAYRHAAERLRGGELGGDLQEIGELVARFSKGTEPIIRDFIKLIASGRESLRILDIGCGSGFFLQSAHAVNPKARGLGLDVDPAVVRQARNNIAAWGLGERFAILEGDIRRAPAEARGPFDLINLANILYYFPAPERAALLADLRARLAPSGMLSVVMHFDSQGKDLAAANLNLVNCSLKGLNPLPRLEEIKGLLERSGFREITVHNFVPASTFQGVTALA